jgi:drug/metabolite transporter (DMT)-like permease
MLRSYVLLTFTMIFFSGNILIGKMINDISPVTMTFIRSLIACLILLPFTYGEIRKHRELWLKEWKPLLGLSLTGVVLFNLLLYSSLQFTSSTNVAVIETTTPVFAIILAMVFLKERLNVFQYVGVALSLFGAMWVITKGSWEVMSGLQFNRGDILVVFAVMAWAAYSLLVKQHMHKFPSYAGISIMLIIAVIVLLPFAAYDWNSQISVPDLTNPELLLGLLYLGIFPAVLALIFWNKGVAVIGPSRASIFLNLLPVFTITGAVLFLNEQVTLIQWLGAVLVILGVYLTNKMKTKVSNFGGKMEEKSIYKADL